MFVQKLMADYVGSITIVSLNAMAPCSAQPSPGFWMKFMRIFLRFHVAASLCFLFLLACAFQNTVDKHLRQFFFVFASNEKVVQKHHRSWFPTSAQVQGEDSRDYFSSPSLRWNCAMQDGTTPHCVRHEKAEKFLVTAFINLGERERSFLIIPFSIRNSRWRRKRIPFIGYFLSKTFSRKLC